MGYQGFLYWSATPSILKCTAFLYSWRQKLFIFSHINKQMHSANSRNWFSYLSWAVFPNGVSQDRAARADVAGPPNRERREQDWLHSCIYPSAADAAAGPNLLNVLMCLQPSAVYRPLVNQIKNPKILTAMFTAVPCAGGWTANLKFDDQWPKVWRSWFRIYSSLL